MQIRVAGQPVDVPEGASLGSAVSQALSKKKMKQVVAVRAGDALYDLEAPLPHDVDELEPVMESDPEGLEVIRHSAAHLMAEAVKTLHPEARVTIGPSIENGFYYDFDYRPFTPEDLEAIEAEMVRAAGRDQPFTCEVMSREEAAELFSGMGEDYKLELLEEIEDETVTVYRHGDFVDLCRGPHVPSTGRVKAFKLLSSAGAYWRGDEANPQLQRIYGTAWASPKDLKKHLERLEEARKRDHRKLGTRLDLFSFSEEAGAGMVIWHPKGALVRTILEDFERKEHLSRGYQIVSGPQILKSDLWQRSGHWDNYRENMYFTSIEDQDYGIKPMNCLAHMLIYKSRMRSYRDLPQRYFELGVVHRHEKSGVLHGLLRVRQFTQDDAHLICRPDQLQDEILGVVSFVRDVMDLFGFEFEAEISTRPEKSIGSDQDWEAATTALKSAMDSAGYGYAINEGDGAFYGPKIDIIIKDALERKWQCATIQCDFTLPERFDLTYVGEDGARHRPVMLHRVILGSLERFLGVLIEHYAGAFPLWLAPEQARVLTVTDEHNEFARKVLDHLVAAGVRAEADMRNEKLGFKVREAQMDKVPYMLVVGGQEVEAGTVNVRTRTGENLGPSTPEAFAARVAGECQEPFKRGGMSYSFSHTGQVQ
jgi:threonyl-tRNA synthetase